MKKIWLTIAGSLLLALTAAQAQDPNTEQSTEYRSTTENKQDSEYSWRDEDREAISQEDLPPTLLETLKSDEYAGWENATIYRNKTSQDYMLVVQEGGNVRTFYFDNEGQAKEEAGSTGEGTTGSGSSGLPPEAGSDYNSGSSSSQSDMNSSDQSRSDMSQDQISSPKTSSDVPSAQPGSETSESTTTMPPPVYPDDTEMGEQETQDQPLGSSGSSGELQTQEPSTSWNAEDRVIVVTEEIPATLLVTLEDDKFEGWENSTVYRNNKTGDYMIEVRDGSSTKVYYFDAEGKEKSDQ